MNSTGAMRNIMRLVGTGAHGLLMVLALLAVLFMALPASAAERRKEKKTEKRSSTRQSSKKTKSAKDRTEKAREKQRSDTKSKSKPRSSKKDAGRKAERETEKTPPVAIAKQDTTPKIPAARFTAASMVTLLSQVSQKLNGNAGTDWQQLIGREGIELKLGNERNRYAAEQAPKAMAILNQSYALGPVSWLHKGITAKGLAYGLGKVKATLRSGTGSGKNTELTLYVVAKPAGDSLNPRAELLKLSITE